MKGIILDIKEKDAAVMTQDGEILSMRNKNYQIGQEITIKEKKKPRYGFVRWAAGAAAAIVVFTGGVFAYTTPAGYVSMDINPSVEFTINMFDRVLDVKGVNDDGKEFISQLKLENKPIGDAIELLTRELVREGYLNEDEEGGIIITTSLEDMKTAERLALRLQERIRNCINEDPDNTDEDEDQNKDDDENDENDDSDENIKIDCMAVGRERVEEARELGVTPGKLNLVQKLVASTENPEEIDVEEWLNKPVKEINKAIKENRKAAKEEMKAEIKESKYEDRFNKNSKDDDTEDPDKENDRNTKQYQNNKYSGDNCVRDENRDCNDDWDDEKNNEFKGNGKDNFWNNGQGNNKNKEKGNGGSDN